jgi:hypothetical protein
MDKIKQNIDLQEAIQRYNIEKSVVGTLAYNIDQNLQKGMSVDEAIENVLQKSKSMPIGTIHNGFKKIAEGKWRKVSESHKMTKEEHLDRANSHVDTMSYAQKNNDDARLRSAEKLSETHSKEASKLDSKDYSDEEVTGGEKKNFSTKEFDTKKEAEKRMSLMNSNSEYSDLKINKTSNNKYTISFKKSQPESTLSKSEQTEAQKAKVKKVVEEFNKGILKSSTGELITDRSEALRFALSEAGIEMKKSEDSDIEKGGEGSRGGKIIGHTKSGKPVYEKSQNLSYNGFTRQDHLDAAEHHNFEKRRAEDALENSKDFNKRKLLKEKINSHSENEKGHIVRAERSKN